MRRHYARELIREGRDRPYIFLENKKFWHPAVFQAFLEEIAEFLYTNGQRAHALAEVGPAFAQLVATQSNVDPNILLVRAYGHLGNSFRVLGRFAEADEAYDKAKALPAPVTEHADIDRRRAYLRIGQGRPEEGHDYAHDAVEVYKKSDELLVDRHPLGLALAARGDCHYYAGRSDQAVADISAAIAMINYRTKPRTYYFALHNLTLYMLDVMTPDSLAQTLQNLEACYRRFVGYSQRHIARYKIRWLQAMAQKRFGSTRQAERFFKKAFNGFVDLETPSEVAMVSLDIALLYIEESRYNEARELANHTYTIANSLGMESRAIAALALWKNATEAELTPTFIASIRSTVAEHAHPFGT